jgi:cytidine deaminase
MNRLSQKDSRRLLRAAAEIREKAHAPYSGFRVGAAVIDGSGTVFAGCNIENGSYGLTVCAERVALFKAVSEGSVHPVAIALVTNSKKPVMPCGACRQVLAEFNPDMLVISGTTGGQSSTRKLSLLLPEAFTFKK